MRELEQLLALFVAAVILAAGARRVGAPYPVFLALGGALLAFLPVAAGFTLPPELALALFVAPVLLDAAFDASLRDLKDNWAPVMGLVIFAVGLTTVAVAVVARAIVPSMPWANIPLQPTQPFHARQAVRAQPSRSGSFPRFTLPTAASPAPPSHAARPLCVRR